MRERDLANKATACKDGLPSFLVAHLFNTSLSESRTCYPEFPICPKRWTSPIPVHLCPFSPRSSTTNSCLAARIPTRYKLPRTRLRSWLLAFIPIEPSPKDYVFPTSS